VGSLRTVAGHQLDMALRRFAAGRERSQRYASGLRLGDRPAFLKNLTGGPCRYALGAVKSATYPGRNPLCLGVPHFSWAYTHHMRNPSRLRGCSPGRVRVPCR
jgi:hypothetical protein